MTEALRPAGSPCPKCGRPIKRRGSAASEDRVLMRCPGCGWTAAWQRPGTVPAQGTIDQAVDDLRWLRGEPPVRRIKVVKF